MELRQLEMLLAVVEEGGYTHASERMYVAHSAIHRQIHLLEEEVRDKILLRVGKRLRLTETGRVLLGLAQKISQEVATVRRELDDLHGLQGGHVRIGTGTTVLHFFLPPVLERFRREFPLVEVHLVTGSASQIVHDTYQGDLDVGIVHWPSDRSQRGSTPSFEVLYDEEFVLGVGRGHPLAGRKSINLTALQYYPLILYPQGSVVRQMLEHSFQSTGLKPTVVMELENEEAMESMVKIHMGVAFLAKRRAVRSRIHYLHITGRPMHCPVGMVFPRFGYRPRAVSEFARMCREALSIPETSNNAEKMRLHSRARVPK